MFKLGFGVGTVVGFIAFPIAFITAAIIVENNERLHVKVFGVTREEMANNSLKSEEADRLIDAGIAAHTSIGFVPITAPRGGIKYPSK